MKKFTLLLLTWLLTVTALHATIRRVGYSAPVNPVTNLDFLNFQAAHDASYEGIILTKSQTHTKLA